MEHLTTRIAQLIEESANRDELLNAVVREVRSSMHVKACSVFLGDEAAERLLLVAADGARSAVTELRDLSGYADDGRLYWQPGGTGTAGNSGKSAATAHDSSSSHSEPILGVPLRRNRRVIGAIVLHGVTRDAVSAADEANLLTASVQVSAALRKLAYMSPAADHATEQARMSGVAGAPGIAIACAVFPEPWSQLREVVDRDVEDPKAEETRYLQAVNSLLAELHAGRERLSDVWPDGLEEVFGVYREIVTDDQFNNAVVNRIRAGQWAPAAIRDAVTGYAAALMEAEDERLSVRAEDLRAIGRRLLFHVSGSSLEKETRRCVLVGTEVNLVRMAEIPLSNLAGIVSFEGSTLSHASLLARSLGIPAVVGTGQLPRDEFDGSLLVVDGYSGRVVANPNPAVLAEYRRLEKEDRDLAEELQTDESGDARTTDGTLIPVLANVSLPADADRSSASAQGVGLYRSEFPFMLRDTLPTEEEQIEIYRKILATFAPRPVFMRTLDIGGDKPLSYLPHTSRNPFLGARGVRIGLDHPEVFVSQIRSMLRAADGFKNLRLLLPMVSTVSEVLEARALISRAQRSLADEGIRSTDIPVGVMVEVPALLFQIPALSRYVDYFSIGTNDLTQYLMAAAREDPEVADLHDHLQPAVLSAVRSIIDSAHQCNREVSVCGELASDPMGIVPLIGMGVDSLSVSPAAIGRVKRIIRSIPRSQAQELTAELLTRMDPDSVRAAITRTLTESGLGGLVRAGR